MPKQKKLSRACNTDLGKDTVDAIKTVVDIARDTIEGERRRFGIKEYDAVVTLDVRNVYNSRLQSCFSHSSFYRSLS